MDPLSIATACVSLTAGISSLALRISTFVAEVRGARKDMDGVLRELTSLKLSLGTLESDSQHRGITYPPGVKDGIGQILVNVEMVTNQINDVLIKLSSGRLGQRVQWAMTEKDEINKLRSSLESNKMALEVALTLGTISILMRQSKSMIKQEDNIAVVLQHTEQISLTTSRIDNKIDVLTHLQKDYSHFDKLNLELAGLQSQLSALSQRTCRQSIMQDFVENSQSYVQVVLETAGPPLPIVSDSQSLLECKEAVQIVRGTETDLTHGIRPCPACGRIFSRREEETAVRNFGNRIEKAKNHWNAQLRASQEEIAKLQREAISACQVADDLESKCRKLQSVKRVCEDLLPETMSEHERRRCAIPLAELSVRGGLDEITFRFESWMFHNWDRKRSGLPQTYDEIMKASICFHIANFYPDKFKSNDTVADVKARYVDPLTKDAGPQNIDTEEFFLQVGLKRLTDDQILRDLDIRGTRIVWLMCKPPNVPDEDIIIQDLAAKPTLRLAVGASDLSVLDGILTAKGVQILRDLNAMDWSTEEN